MIREHLGDPLPSFSRARLARQTRASSRRADLQILHMQLLSRQLHERSVVRRLQVYPNTHTKGPGGEGQMDLVGVVGRSGSE
jgi:hypothetical protein